MQAGHVIEVRAENPRDYRPREGQGGDEREHLYDLTHAVVHGAQVGREGDFGIVADAFEGDIQPHVVVVDVAEIDAVRLRHVGELATAQPLHDVQLRAEEAPDLPRVRTQSDDMEAVHAVRRVGQDVRLNRV